MMAHSGRQNSRNVDPRPNPSPRPRSMSTTAVVGGEYEPRRETQRRGGRTQEDRQRRGRNLNINLDDVWNDASRPQEYTGQEKRYLFSLRDITALIQHAIIKAQRRQISPSVSTRGGRYNDDDTDGYFDDSHSEDYRELRSSQRSYAHGAFGSRSQQQQGHEHSTPSRRSTGPESDTYVNSSQSTLRPSSPLYYVPDDRSRGQSSDRVIYRDTSAQTDPSDYDRRHTKPESHRRSRPYSYPVQDPMTSHTSSSRQNRKSSGSNTPPRQPSYHVVVTPDPEINDGSNHRHHAYDGYARRQQEEEEDRRKRERNKTRRGQHRESLHRPKAEYVYESKDGVRDRRSRDDYDHDHRRKSRRRDNSSPKCFSLLFNPDRWSKYS